MLPPPKKTLNSNLAVKKNQNSILSCLKFFPVNIKSSKPHFKNTKSFFSRLIFYKQIKTKHSHHHSRPSQKSTITSTTNPHHISIPTQSRSRSKPQAQPTFSNPSSSPSSINRNNRESITNTIEPVSFEKKVGGLFFPFSLCFLMFGS